MTKASMRGIDSRKGFTLLEVLIATSLFITGITFLMAAYLNTLYSINGVQVNQSLEQDMAMIRERVLVLSDVQKIEDGGDVITGQHGEVRWEVNYEPTEIADLFKVTLSVELDSEDEEAPESAEQVFYLMRPTWSDPVDRSELRARTKDRFLERQARASR